METWQRYWLYISIIYFSFHLIRDIFQSLHIHNFISDTLSKSDLSKTPTWYWKVFNEYAIEISEILLVIYCFKNGTFGLAGYLTIFIALIFFTAWLFYWVFL